MYEFNVLSLYQQIRITTNTNNYGNNIRHQHHRYQAVI